MIAGHEIADAIDIYRGDEVVLEATAEQLKTGVDTRRRRAARAILSRATGLTTDKPSSPGELTQRGSIENLEAHIASLVALSPKRITYISPASIQAESAHDYRRVPTHDIAHAGQSRRDNPEVYAHHLTSLLVRQLQRHMHRSNIAQVSLAATIAAANPITAHIGDVAYADSDGRRQTEPLLLQVNSVANLLAAPRRAIERTMPTTSYRQEWYARYDNPYYFPARVAQPLFDQYRWTSEALPGETIFPVVLVYNDGVSPHKPNAAYRPNPETPDHLYILPRVS